MITHSITIRIRLALPLHMLLPYELTCRSESLKYCLSLGISFYFDPAFNVPRFPPGRMYMVHYRWGVYKPWRGNLGKTKNGWIGSVDGGWFGGKIFWRSIHPASTNSVHPSWQLNISSAALGKKFDLLREKSESHGCVSSTATNDVSKGFWFKLLLLLETVI